MDNEVFINVRSQDRISGTPSHYTVNLPSMIPNVIQIEFVSSEIPNTIFSTTTSYFFFTINYTLSGSVYDTEIIIPIQPGIYETNDLMNTMTSNMYIDSEYLYTNTKLDPTIVNFMYNEHLAIICMKQGTNPNSTINSITIDEGTDPRYGFQVGPLSLNTVSNTYNAQSIALFNGTPVIFVCLEQMNDSCSSYFINPVSSNTPLRNVIARIPMNADILHYVVSSPNTVDYVRPILLSRPLNLSQLTISIVLPDGTHADFQGVEHSLLLKVTVNRS